MRRGIGRSAGVGARWACCAAVVTAIGLGVACERGGEGAGVAAPRAEVDDGAPGSAAKGGGAGSGDAGAAAASGADATAAVATVEDEEGDAAAEPKRDPRLPGSYRENSASTAVATRDRKLFIAGQDRSARHAHGGAPARIGSVSFAVTNDSDEVRRITAKRVEFLRDKDCEAPPTTVASRPKLGDLVFEDDEDPRAPTLSLDIPPKTSREVRVGFESVEAYYVWCDRFAIRVQFTVKGESLAPVAELAVMRMEPLLR